MDFSPNALRYAHITQVFGSSVIKETAYLDAPQEPLETHSVSSAKLTAQERVFYIRIAQQATIFVYLIVPVLITIEIILLTPVF